MGVMRTHKKKNYTVISNTILRDEKISLKAKGMLCVVWSLPDKWEYSVKGFEAIFKEGRDAIISTLDELEDAGYLVRTKYQNDKGQWDCDYDWYDEPCRKTRYGKPVTENPTQLNKENQVKKSNNNTINSIIVRPEDGVQKPVGMNVRIARTFEHWGKVMGVKMKSTKLNGLACKRLIEFCGGDEEQLCRVISALPTMIKEEGKYAIRVADFVELEQKWNKIMAWGRAKAIAQQTKVEEQKADEEYKPFG